MDRRPTWGRRGAVVLAGGAALLVLLSLSAVHSQEGASLDVSGYPADQQRRYKIFAEKCSRCHDLSRPLTAKYNDAGWRDLVQRMARRPGANISRRDQQQISEFLIFHSRQRRSGGTAPAGGSAETPVAPAAAPVTLGQAAQGGVRVEVSARGAQTFVQLAEGKWVQATPGAGENTYLEVRVFDAGSGEKIPYAAVKARFRGESGEGPEKTLAPVYGPEGFHYGANFAAQPPLRVQVTIEPPAVTRVGDGAARWLAPITLQFAVQNGAGG